MEKRTNLDTSRNDTAQMGQITEGCVTVSKNQRRSFERRWYDNNFFDDGFHFRFLSRQSNKIVDLSERSTIYSPTRVVPKSSRQIRGMANLLLFNDPTPSIYPQNISRSDFANDQEYQIAWEQARQYALRTGHWLTEEWKNQELMDKLSHMVILTMKHGVSYLQVWADPVMECIKTQVYDAFDIYLMGNLTSIYDSPYIIKGVPMLVAEIKANENFDEDQKEKLNPDNKYASSELKDAYMQARFGRENTSDQTATVVLKEAYFKEYLNDLNMSRIRSQDDGDKILKGKKKGDPIIRQVFSAAGVWLRDTYTSLPDYPFVDFRIEPGSIYQVPTIERFIPSNKSLDMVVSRIERYTHTMATGVWLKKQGEQFKISNMSGGQEIEYATTPPVQAQVAPLPQFLFQFLGLLTSYIEEQGVTTTTLGKLPTGVRANSAIESLKESELANLVIASRQIKKTIKKISEKMLDIVDSTFVTPQTVYLLDKGKPDYFDIIGDSALSERKRLKIATSPYIVPVKKDYRVEIEIEAGLGYTKEGQKETMQKLATFLTNAAANGLINPNVIKYVVRKMIEVFQFGKDQELMEAINQDVDNMSDDQLKKMQIAILQALKDAGEVGEEASQKRIQESAIGAAQAIKDTGLADSKPQDPKLEAEVARIVQDIRIKEEEHKLKMAQGEQEMEIKEEEAELDQELKGVQGVHKMAIKEEESRQNMKIKKKMAEKGAENASKDGVQSKNNK